MPRAQDALERPTYGELHYLAAIFFSAAALSTS
jgi:hypothetical protein